MPRPVSSAASRASSGRAAPSRSASRAALKSPLQTSTMSQVLPPSRPDEDGSSGAAVSVLPVAKVTSPQLRKMQISEFCAWLRTQTNKHKRPFQEQRITDYAEPARALDRWMTEQEIDGDFTACDVAVLNTFFSQYRADHG
jgi:hypothetical protein